MLERFDELAEGLNHPEGVTWNRVDGSIYAGGEGGEFYAVSLDGEVTQVASTGGSMLGLAVDGRGRVYACDAGKGEIARLDPATGAVETYARGVGGGDMDCPNVAAFGPDGVLYVTCSGEDGRPEIVRISPGATTAERWTTAVPAYPNGCLVTPDGSALVVVEAKAERVVRVPIRADGSAGEPETIAELPDTDADGIALDAEGNLWVTLYRPDGIVRVAPDGAHRPGRRRPPGLDPRCPHQHRVGGLEPRSCGGGERRGNVALDRRPGRGGRAAAPARDPLALSPLAVGSLLR